RTSTAIEIRTPTTTSRRQRNIMLFNALDYRPRRRIHLLITREYPRFTAFSKGSEKILWRKSHSRKFSCIVSPFSVGLVAQLVEQRIENPCVGGSIPPKATIEFI